VATGKLPSSTILRLPGGPLQARPDLTLAEWALLCRVDGRRPVSALANRSGRGHHEAVALAERLLAAGLLELTGGSDDAGAPHQAGAAGAEADHGRDGAAEVGASWQAGGVGAEADGQPGGAAEPGEPQEEGTAGAGVEDPVRAVEVRVGADEPGAAGAGLDDRVDSAAGALAVAELSGLSSPDGRGEGDRPARTEAAAELAGLSSADAPQKGFREGDQPADGASDGVGPGTEPEGSSGAGAPGGGGAAPGRDRIDPVSLLRELAAEGPAAEGAPAGDGEDRTGQADGERPEQPAGGDRRPPDEPARPPGRGANQAEFLREFASLAMGGDPADDPDPGPQPDGEPADDERGRGRFGFRRGQRR
jgi:hypothetical protein